MDELQKLFNNQGIAFSVQDMKEYKLGRQPYYMDKDGDVANEFYELIVDKSSGKEILIQVFP